MAYQQDHIRRQRICRVLSQVASTGGCGCYYFSGTEVHECILVPRHGCVSVLCWVCECFMLGVWRRSFSCFICNNVKKKKQKILQLRMRNFHFASKIFQRSSTNAVSTIRTFGICRLGSCMYRRCQPRKTTRSDCSQVLLRVTVTSNGYASARPQYKN